MNQPIGNGSLQWHRCSMCEEAWIGSHQCKMVGTRVNQPIGDVMRTHAELDRLRAANKRLEAALADLVEAVERAHDIEDLVLQAAIEAAKVTT